MLVDLTKNDLQRLLNLYVTTVALDDRQDDDGELHQEFRSVMKLAKLAGVSAHDLDMMARKKLDEICSACRITKLRKLAEKHDKEKESQ